MKKLAFCFDLDGTVTTEEILPLIAKEVKLYEEIKLITKITLNGLIPFENSFNLRVKLLSSVPISTVRNVVNKVKMDSNISEFIRTHREDCYIVTGNLDVWINDYIKQELGCKYFSSKADFDGDKLIGLNSILNKGSAIEELREEYEKIIVIGDSMNDCSMADKSDISIAYGGIHEPVSSLVLSVEYVIYNSKSLVRLLNNFIKQ